MRIAALTDRDNNSIAPQFIHNIFVQWDNRPLLPESRLDVCVFCLFLVGGGIVYINVLVLADCLANDEEHPMLILLAHDGDNDFAGVCLSSLLLSFLLYVYDYVVFFVIKILSCRS